MRRRRDHAAKGAADAIALVIGHDQEHVGRAFGWHDRWRPIRFGIGGGVLDHPAEFRVGRRDLFSVNRDSGAGRTRRAGDLDLRLCGRRDSHQGRREHCACRECIGLVSYLPLLLGLFGILIFVSPVKSRASSCADQPARFTSGSLLRRVRHCLLCLFEELFLRDSPRFQLDR